MQKITTHAERARYGYLEAWVSIIGNIALSALKLVLAILSGSISLMADAFHTLSDVVTSFIVLIGFRVAKSPADRDHPFGHGRMESIATLIVAVLLVVAGTEFIKRSILRFIDPPEVSGSLFIAAVMVITGLAKEWMAWFAFKLGKKIDSSALKVDAWHHRTDAIASILVAIAIIAARFGYMRVDPVLGIVVAIIIIYVALTIGFSSINYLLGKAPSHEMIELIRKSALTFPDVIGVHGVHVHSYGEHRAVSLHIEIDASTDLEKAHRIASSVESRIAKGFNASCVVHVDLRTGKKEDPCKIESVIDGILTGNPNVAGYHGIEVISTETADNIFIHVTVPKEMSVERSHQLSHEITDEILKHLPGFEISIHIEPA